MPDLRNLRKRYFLYIVLAICILAVPFRAKLRSSIISGIQMLRGKRTVAERIEQFGEIVRSRLEPDFERVGIAYPPAHVILLGLKHEGRLEVWVSADGTTFRLLKDYPILGMSGSLGPKLREGDKQVPEGLYRIESLNPNSMFHLALRLDYPNGFDRRKSKLDGRENLGTDIMIHGGHSSVGCLAMGDTAAEDLFILAAETGIENCSAILSPVDFRIHDPQRIKRELPAWTPELYETIETAMAKLQKT
jgi:hypothetical protein